METDRYTTPRTEEVASKGAADRRIAEGSILKNQYLLERKIGEGGMGVIFRARDLEEERIAREYGGTEGARDIAIKIVHAELRERGNAVFYQEMRKTRLLVHQNIVRAFDCQQDGELLFMTMEFLEGKTLQALLDEDFAQGMPWDRARPIIEGMGNGLAYAHDHGLVHCDFKLSNVMVTSAFTPKILDFGIARAARGQPRSGSNVPFGLTPLYASPETIRAWQHGGMADYRPDRRDDIFALACVIFELLTGRHPFGDKFGDAEQARQQQFTCPAIPELSGQQNRALAKAMAFDREHRTPKVGQFLQEFLGSARKDGTSWRSRWLWAAATGIGALIVVAVVVEVPRVRNAVSRSPTSPAPVPAAPGRDVTAATRQIVGRLGIDPRLVNRNTIKAEPDLLHLIETAPRRVQLGSTPAEIQAATVLCAQCPREWYADEEVRESTLKPFVLDTTPVTVGAFKAFAEAREYRTGAEKRGFAYTMNADTLVKTPSLSWRSSLDAGQPAMDLPVVAVDFEDAKEFCAWKGKRLPTEDEWEYAARGPERHIFPWGNEFAPALDPVSRLPRADAEPKEGIGGAYRGMSGVVWEWVDTDVGSRKVLKGGSWIQANPATRRAAAHRYEKPDTADSASGFRCAATATVWPDAQYWLDTL